MIIKIKTSLTILLFLLLLPLQLQAKDYIGHPINGLGGSFGKVSKNKQGKVIGIKCPKSITNNSVVNLNCGFAKKPGPVLVINRGNSTLITRYCKGVPCGSLKKAGTSKRGENLVKETPKQIASHKSQTKKHNERHTKNLHKTIRKNYKNGKPKSIAIMNNNKILDLTLYYPNSGKKYRRIIRKNIVSATHYYQNGKIQESYQFKSYPSLFQNEGISRRQAINTSREYYPSGRLYRETNWKGNQKVRIRIFDKNGKLRKK